MLIENEQLAANALNVHSHKVEKYKVNSGDDYVAS